MPIAGGVSESIRTFGIFAGFASQGALAANEDPAKASRPFDRDRNGIVVSEGGCLYTLERLSDAKRRGAKIYGELVGHAMTSDASDFVLPSPEGQARCMQLALKRAGLNPEDIDLIVCATVTPDHMCPSTACMVQGALGCRPIPAMDISAACTGFLYAMSTGEQFLRSGAAKNVLVVGTDVLSRTIDLTDRNTCILFGDGAGAVVMTPTETPDHGIRS